MKKHLQWFSILLGVAALAATLSAGEQWRNSLGGGDREGWWEGIDTAKTARESPFRSGPVPTWTNSLGFEKDAFTFARVRYTRMNPRSGGIWWGGGFWYSDSPDSDLNLSFRLQQLTSLKSNPDGRFIDLTDKDLTQYPWIYIVEPGLMHFDDEEVTALRAYLLSGGFLMVDDFWGAAQWGNFEREMKRVFPEKSFQDLEIEHPIFHTVFDLKGPKENLQIPNVMIGRRYEELHQTWENHVIEPGGPREPCKDIHFRALFDNKDRLMVFACLNTDNGDGWEREGEDETFFRHFSEAIAYPLAINVIFYAMTH
ncbi:MAG TPA: DUF4159 domain-containing protein [Verrucomicrobiae bacterium]|jgi:hypothetical protein|nr:DUF4159 domain-containing protein [Verrucomicrobiae bacterium]